MTTPAVRVCGVSDCERPHSARGYCGTHYRRWRTHGDTTTVLRRGGPVGALCGHPGCERVRLGGARGLCTLHYQRLRDGVPLDKPAPPLVKVNRNGYRMVYVGPGRPRQMEHRLVMAEILGRELLPTETVHHRNGDRADNTPANLELWVQAQPYGQRAADLVAFARDVLARYGDLPAGV